MQKRNMSKKKKWEEKHEQWLIWWKTRVVPVCDGRGQSSLLLEQVTAGQDADDELAWPR